MLDLRWVVRDVVEQRDDLQGELGLLIAASRAIDDRSWPAVGMAAYSAIAATT